MELLLLKANRVGENGVRGRDHPEIVAARFGLREDKGGRARQHQRRRNLTPDMSAFSDAGHDLAPTASEDHFDCNVERVPQLSIEYLGNPPKRANADSDAQRASQQPDTERGSSSFK